VTTRARAIPCAPRLYRFYLGIAYEVGLRHSTEHGDRNTVPGNHEPDANGPLWSVAEYDVLCVVK
jgi:hypothetical protein